LPKSYFIVHQKQVLEQHIILPENGTLTFKLNTRWETNQTDVQFDVRTNGQLKREFGGEHRFASHIPSWKREKKQNTL